MLVLEAEPQIEQPYVQSSLIMEVYNLWCVVECVNVVNYLIVWFLAEVWFEVL